MPSPREAHQGDRVSYAVFDNTYIGTVLQVIVPAQGARIAKIAACENGQRFTRFRPLSEVECLTYEGRA